MARFPLPESEVLALAQNLAAGLANHPEVFPAPPAGPEVLQSDLEECQAALAAVQSAMGRIQEAIHHKDELFDRLKARMKQDLRYAETYYGDQNDKLKLLGWSARRAKQKRSAPGQVTGLTVTLRDLGRGFILRWQPPIDGGAVAVYRVEARNPRDSAGSDRTSQMPPNVWTLIDTTTEPEFIFDAPPPTHPPTLPTGPTEYRVIALNRTGRGLPSNIVAVT